MITVGMNYKVLPDKGEVFERAFEAVLQAMASMDGHTDSQLYKNVADPQSYLIISEWKSREAFDSFVASDEFRRVTNWGKEQILAGRPKHAIYEQ